MTTAQALARLEVRLARLEALLESRAEEDGKKHHMQVQGVDLGEARSRNILRLTEVKKKTGLSRATIYAQQTQRVFPPRVNLGPRAVGWIESEVDAVIAARASGGDETSLKTLVELLVASRQR